LLKVIAALLPSILLGTRISTEPSLPFLPAT